MDLFLLDPRVAEEVGEQILGITIPPTENPAA